MGYSISLLTAKPDCEAAVADANEDRVQAAFQLTVAGHSQTTRATAAAETAGKLVFAIAQVTALTTIIPTLPEASREDRELEKRKFERERDRLLDQQKRDGIRDLLARERRVKNLTAGNRRHRRIRGAGRGPQSRPGVTGGRWVRGNLAKSSAANATELFCLRGRAWRRVPGAWPGAPVRPAALTTGTL